MVKRKLIIVGGGVCGLVAAKELLPYFDVTIIEANKKLGGRIFTDEDPAFKIPLELGPEFVHGNLPGTLHLLREADIATVAVEGRLRTKINSNWEAMDAAVEGWDKMLKMMKHLKEDSTLEDFLSLNFSDQSYEPLRDYVLQFASGFDLADPAKASVKALQLEWSNEERTNYRIPQGYGSLINHLEWECLQKNCSIILGKPVATIQWSSGAVTVITSDGQKFEAAKLIVTVPITALRAGELNPPSIELSPALENYTKAAGQIVMGHVIKVFAQFKKSFWPEDAGFFLTDERVPTWWTQLPNKVPVLTGWAGGLKADALLHLNNSQIESIAMQSLANAFDKTLDFLNGELESIKVHNWATHKWIGGGYSYSTLESAKAKAILNTPVSETIYFSGEAVYEGDVPGTVEAAIIQARETVYQILKS